MRSRSAGAARPEDTTTRHVSDRWWWLAIALAVGSAAIVATYRDYGSNWDEAVQARYGELAVSYFRSGMTDTRCNRFQDLRFYGPLVEMLPAVLYGDAKTGTYELRHLIIPFIGLATLPAVFLYASLGAIPGLPLFALLALATMPRFYGDWFNNSKDVPFACLVAWSMCALALLFRRRQFAWWRVVVCGVAFGLTLDVRPGGLPLLAVLFAAAAATGLLTTRRDRRAATGGEALLIVALQGVAVLLIAWGIMVLPWPWAHEDPILHPIEAMRVAASFTASYPVLFDGTVLKSSAVPRTYLPWYLLITTPPLVLALAVVGVIGGVAGVRRAAPRSFPFLLALCWLAIPVGLFVVVRPNVYDGIRHFLFVLPAIAILAAYGATWLCARVSPRRRGAAMALTAVLLLLPIKDLVALHPYQTAYFNGLVGGVAGADDRYDTEYWLTSYREAIDWVNDEAAKRPDEVTTVAVAGDGYITPWVSYYAAPNVRARIVATPPEQPLLPDGTDYYIASKRWGFHRGFAQAPIVHTIGREGAVFTVIKGRGAAP